MQNFYDITANDLVKWLSVRNWYKTDLLISQIYAHTLVLGHRNFNATSLPKELRQELSDYFYFPHYLDHFSGHRKMSKEKTVLR